MYVILSLLTLTAVLTIGLLCSFLPGAAATAAQELVFLLGACAGGCMMIRFSDKHPEQLTRTPDLYEITALRPVGLRSLSGTLLLTLGAFALCQLYAGASAVLFPEAVQNGELGTASRLLFVSLPERLLLYALVPAVCEEVLFRGTVYYSFTRHTTVRAAVWMTAILFGSFHMDPVRLPTAVFMGLILGYTRLRGDSILAPVSAHLLNNLLTVLLTSFPAAAAFVGSIGAHWWLTAALVLLGAGALCLEREPRRALSRHWVTAAVVCIAASGLFLILRLGV